MPHKRFTDAGMAYFNTPTDVQRDNVQDYAEVDGYRVFLEKRKSNKFTRC